MRGQDLNLRPLGYERNLAKFSPVQHRPSASGSSHRRRLRARRQASTIDANCDGSMIGRPRQGDMPVRSASADTIRNAPTTAARSRIRLSSQSGQSPTVCGGSVMPPPDALGHLGQRPQVVIHLLIRGLQHRRQHPAGIGQDVRREPQRELRRVVDNAQAIRTRVPRRRRRRRPAPERGLPHGNRQHEHGHVKRHYHRLLRPLDLTVDKRHGQFNGRGESSLLSLEQPAHVFHVLHCLHSGIHCRRPLPDNVSIADIAPAGYDWELGVLASAVVFRGGHPRAYRPWAVPWSAGWPGRTRYRGPAGRRPSGAGVDCCHGRQVSAVLAPGTATSTGPKGCPALGRPTAHQAPGQGLPRVRRAGPLRDRGYQYQHAG